jgi:hypothetical protein
VDSAAFALVEFFAGKLVAACCNELEAFLNAIIAALISATDRVATPVPWLCVEDEPLIPVELAVEALPAVAGEASPPALLSPLVAAPVPCRPSVFVPKEASSDCKPERKLCAPCGLVE